MTNWSITEAAMIEKAESFAKKAHAGQIRKSGEPYITHLIAVYDMLIKVNADAETVAAALLHDTIEDTKTTYEDIQREFGVIVAKLVEGVTKVQILEGNMDKNELSMQTIRKIFRTMGKDIRVIFIKLADRLHNMRTIEFMGSEQQQRIARETQDIYCPLADLLGINVWFRELSDLSFQRLDNTAYKLISRKEEIARKSQYETLEKWVIGLETALHLQGWESAKVKLLKKNCEEIFMQTEDKESILKNIETFYSVHITIPNNKDCYAAMGSMHELVVLMPSAIQDYIALPKINGYRALHSTIITPNGNPINFIFQTEDMYECSYFGALMMYRNHDNKKSQKEIPDWVSTILSLEQGEEDAHSFFDTLHSEIFGERMRVYLDKARHQDVEVPFSSTLLDVAFYIDTTTGLQVESATINNQETNLKTIPSQGDVIHFKKRAKKNLRSASDLHFLRTSLARKLLTNHLSTLPTEECLRHGSMLLQHTIDISMDPFFGIAWQKKIRMDIMRDEKELIEIGAGITNPFVYIQENASPEDFLLLDPRCFMIISRMTPSAGMHYVLRTTLEDLHSGNILGIQSGPDVIDIISADILQNKRRYSKEYVPIRTRTAFLDFPFFFALRFNYQEHTNPLTDISTLQNMLDTPVNLLQFESNSVTLGFHTDSMHTIQSTYEYLSSLPYISNIFRITPP